VLFCRGHGLLLVWTGRGAIVGIHAKLIATGGKFNATLDTCFYSRLRPKGGFGYARANGGVFDDYPGSISSETDGAI